MKIIEGKIRIRLLPLKLKAQRDDGIQDTAIIHEELDWILAQLNLFTQARVKFYDCEIKEFEQEILPF